MGVYQVPAKPHKFLVIGHRGNGMNMLQSSYPCMLAIKENTLLSLNTVGKGKFPVNFVEFAVQVTRDDCPVIFHDDYIYSLENGTAIEKKVTDLTLAEFLSYGPQRQPGRSCKSLLRKTEDGEFLDWKVQQDDCFYTLKDAFGEVDSSLSFNVELKFDDDFIYEEKVLIHVLEEILKVVFKYAKQRSIIFSSFHPDVASLMRMLQNIYPVFFLIDGGSYIYRDLRRNSLDGALRLCMENRLQGIVSEVNAVFRNLEAISKIKQSNLSLLTYGQLNNLPEPVRMQYLMGVDGVIVDLVSKIAEAVSGFINKSAETKKERTMVVSTERPTYLQQILSRSLQAHA